jgi:YebC/PmpR family DNA-binding regulatory protein
MAGHSHWKNTKRAKDIEAKKRSLVFSRIGKVISLRAKDGGGDIEKNPALKAIVEVAKKMNLPKENIEKAIKKGVGELKNNLQEFTFEFYGPEGTAFIVDGITDNINRVSSELKKIFNSHGGKPAEPGSVKWLFKRLGLIESTSKEKTENIELIIIDSGAYDFEKNNGDYLIYTDPKELNNIKNYVESKNLEVVSFSLIWASQSKIKVDSSNEKNCLKIFEELNGNEDVQGIYSNLENKL